MHPFLVLSLAILTCSAAISLALAMKPFLPFFNGPAVALLLRRAVPAARITTRLFGQLGVSDLVARCLARTGFVIPSTRDPTPSQTQPSSIQEVRHMSSTYKRLWLRTRRVLVKASVNVLRRRAASVSLPSWAMGFSIHRSAVTPSGFTPVIFAARPPLDRISITRPSTLTGYRALWLLVCSSFVYPAQTSLSFDPSAPKSCVSCCQDSDRGLRYPYKSVVQALTAESVQKGVRTTWRRLNLSKKQFIFEMCWEGQVVLGDDCGCVSPRSSCWPVDMVPARRTLFHAGDGGSALAVQSFVAPRNTFRQILSSVNVFGILLACSMRHVPRVPRFW